MQVSIALSSFIDDNSRLEKKSGKRIRHALENIVGLKQGAFHRLASTTRRVILCAKIVAVFLELRASSVLRALQISP